MVTVLCPPRPVSSRWLELPAHAGHTGLGLAGLQGPKEHGLSAAGKQTQRALNGASCLVTYKDKG